MDWHFSSDEIPGNTVLIFSRGFSEKYRFARKKDFKIYTDSDMWIYLSDLTFLEQELIVDEWKRERFQEKKKKVEKKIKRKIKEIMRKESIEFDFEIFEMRFLL